ncbi:MAG TPA: RdgB/HAM1 family non-canonical purine NTP pyrophosphatase [Stellaceae bacterium]|nr:RdgB/HAM1 family non-canonical purine NTP pyrophosphatase [Stellaceae bacterium]
MARRLVAGSKLVIATHNKGKLVEMADLLRPYGLEAVSAGALGLPEPEETGSTFEENAAIKAHAAAAASKLPSLADDSGLVVSGIGGAPGIYSARWAVNKDFAPAMARVERELGTNPDRRAYFVAMLALAWPDGHLENFRGEVHGSVTFPPRGLLGFGYDPIFQPDGMSESFGELDTARRMRISHRTVAFRQLAEVCLPVPKSP